jgi:FMN phosphatase YigB (HAD superfamily)
MPITTCVLDAYGTLFDAAAAARNAAPERAHAAIADSWTQLAEHWRLKQLRHSWRRAITGAHRDPRQVTRDALDRTLEKTGHHYNSALRARLLRLSAGLATGCGITTAGISRAGDPVDRLPWRPAHILNDLNGIPELASI